MNKDDSVLGNRECAGLAAYPAPVKLSSFKVHRKIEGYKVEALAEPQVDASSEFTIASEDEGGGSWWNKR